jgi:uracil-DNA glycosylase
MGARRKEFTLPQSVLEPLEEHVVLSVRSFQKASEIAWIFRDAVRMRTIAALIEAVEDEARRADFPVDTPAYRKAGREPLSPILFAGALRAPVCALGRDLGKDEVMMGQPLVGAAGRMVRAGVYQACHGTPPPSTDRTLESVLEHVLLTNTVPYKPPGNKAYAPVVKERFRPFLAELLATHWQGDQVITLGTEAFLWFAPFADPQTFNAFWHSANRYEDTLRCVLTATAAVTGVHSTMYKSLSIMPLPHPSPLNRRWYKQFPELLARRLAAVGLSPS